MTRTICASDVLRWTTAALVAFCCTPAGLVFAVTDDCTEGVDFQTIDYFKPPKSDYVKYVNQGGFLLSLCNDPHGPVLSNKDANFVCENIDLKGYLYLPKPENTVSGIFS